MKPLTYASENIFMSHARTAALTPCCASFPIWTMSGTLSWLADGLFNETLDGMRKECSLSRREAPSSLQLVPYSFCKQDHLWWLSSGYLQIVQQMGYCLNHSANVFSRASWFRFLFSRNMNLCSSLTFLHKMLHSTFCEGWGCIGSDSLLRKVQVFTLSTALLQYSMCLLVWWQRKSFPRSGESVTSRKLSKRSSYSLTNVVVARHLLSMWPEKNITNLYIISDLPLYKVRVHLKLNGAECVCVCVCERMLHRK